MRSIVLFQASEAYPKLAEWLAALVAGGGVAAAAFSTLEVKELVGVHKAEANNNNRQNTSSSSGTTCTCPDNCDPCCCCPIDP